MWHLKAGKTAVFSPVSPRLLIGSHDVTEGFRSIGIEEMDIGILGNSVDNDWTGGPG